MTHKLIAILILTAEIAAAAYLALVVWLACTWIVDDSVAFQMTDADWWFVGARRLGLGVLIAAVFGGVLLFVNRRWVAPSFGGSRAIALVPVLLGIAVVGVATAGAVTFVVTRPYM